MDIMESEGQNLMTGFSAIRTLTFDLPESEASFINVLSLAINLNQITVTMADKEGVDNLLQAIRCHNRENMNELRRFSFYELNFEQLQILLEICKLTPPLSLEFFLNDFSIPEATKCSTLTSLLQACSTAVEHLSIETVTADQPSAFVQWANVSLPCLKSLQVTPTGILSALEFGHNFPELTTLSLTKLYYELPRDFANQGPCNTITKLSVSGTDIRGLALDQLATLFPYVTSFKFVVGSGVDEHHTEILRGLWTTWPQLQELRLFMSGFNLHREPGYLDSLITGIPRRICDNIYENFSYGKVKLESVKTYAGITDLTRLKFLEISIGFMFPKDNDLMTDVTGHLALTQLKELQHLAIAPSDITRNCIQAIVNSLPELEEYEFSDADFKLVNSFPRDRPSCYLELQDLLGQTNGYRHGPEQS